MVTPPSWRAGPCGSGQSAEAAGRSALRRGADGAHLAGPAAPARVGGVVPGADAGGGGDGLLGGGELHRDDGDRLAVGDGEVGIWAPRTSSPLSWWCNGLSAVGRRKLASMSAGGGICRWLGWLRRRPASRGGRPWRSRGRRPGGAGSRQVAQPERQAVVEEGGQLAAVVQHCQVLGAVPPSVGFVQTVARLTAENPAAA